MTHRTVARLITLSLAVLSASALARESDELSADALAKSRPHTVGGIKPPSLRGPKGASSMSGLAGLDSIANFNGTFRAAGVDPTGLPNDIWVYNMVGNGPTRGGTTVFPAPLIPVSVQLLDSDGKPRVVNGHPLYSDATQYIPAVLASPVFQNASYSSSPRPTQFSDAVFRAQFWRHRESGEGENQGLDGDWHTLLKPAVKTPRVMKVPYGAYQFALNPDGTCCKFILVDVQVFAGLLFPPTAPVDATTVIGAAELAGDMTSHDITSLLFPNTFLYLGGDLNNCCAIGFHSFDEEPGDASNGNRVRRYVMNFSSWVSPDIFGPTLSDITALSHELSETYDDPFVSADGVHNITPFWLAPNGNCQNNLEDGDVIEGLPNSTYPMTLNGYTYHPQNEALLPWFEFQSPSLAIDGAYSYPNESVLTAPSSPQRAFCQ